MLTEEEFYRRKIFFKEKIPLLRKVYPTQVSQINKWKGCDEYNNIQNRKSFIEAKLNQYVENEQIELVISGELLYKIYLWWKNEPKRCYYCNLLESDLEILYHQAGHINKRYPNRGKSLEFDRKNPHGSYTETSNLVLACYWCNNAKTDTFTEEEFKEVGEKIQKIWEKRLGKKLL